MRVVWLLAFLGGCVATPKAHPVFQTLQPKLTTAERVDDVFSMEQRMELYRVPSATVALIEKGSVAEIRHWGPGDPDTLYQVASVSKPLSAVVLLRLLHRRGIELDTPVNTLLRGWTLIDDRSGSPAPTTVRQLLQHRGGTNVSGFQGYEKGTEPPDTLAVLDGAGRSPPVRVVRDPGSEFSYSGGGFTVLQALVEELTGAPFAEVMRTELFEPMQSSRSTFDLYPTGNVALAHDAQGQPLQGGWYVYPELAAAGMWSTAKELAEFVLAVAKAERGEHPLLPPGVAREMVTESEEYGLGFRAEAESRSFFHGGQNPGGYSSFVFYHRDKRVGAAITTNSVAGIPLITELVMAIERHYGLSGEKRRVVSPVSVPRQTLERYAGEYRYRKLGDYRLKLFVDPEGRLTLLDPNDGKVDHFIALGDTEFIDLDGGEELRIELNDDGTVRYLEYVGQVRFHPVD